VRRLLAVTLSLAALSVGVMAEGQQPSAAPAPARSGKAGGAQPVTVDAEKMERFGKEGLVIFTGNVVARQNNNVQYADRMEVYFDEKENHILRTVSTGNVRIITADCRTGTARRAEYHDLEQRVVLIGNARVWQEDNVVSGDTITIYISQDRTVVEGGKQERVKGIFYSRGETKSGETKTGDTKTAAAPARSSAAQCAN
jgi:lipopolysaccharide export system protein LptA